MATERDNTFTLKMGKGLSKLKFDLQDNHHTTGQPWHGLKKISHKGSDYTLHILSGRKGDKRNAKWFKDKVTEKGMAIGCYTRSEMPKELNFAFLGTMHFNYEGKTYTCKDIVIGQGHGGGRNNWWLGGRNMRGFTDQPWIGVIGAPFYLGDNPIPSGLIGFGATIKDVSQMHMYSISLGENVETLIEEAEEQPV